MITAFTLLALYKKKTGILYLYHKRLRSFNKCNGKECECNLLLLQSKHHWCQGVSKPESILPEYRGHWTISSALLSYFYPASAMTNECWMDILDVSAIITNGLVNQTFIYLKLLGEWEHLLFYRTETVYSKCILNQ